MPMTLFLLRGESYVEFCDINLAFIVSFAIAGSASLHHLAVIRRERYFALKHTFTHGTFVFKVCLLVASALAWFTAIVLLVMAPHVKAIWAFHPAVILSIIVFQVLVYRHARRHEQQILAQQVSLDARAKFEKEKKALKLTAKFLVVVVGCYAPVMIFTLAGMIFAKGISADFQTAGRHLLLLPPILNSVINPVKCMETKDNPEIQSVNLILSVIS